MTRTAFPYPRIGPGRLSEPVWMLITADGSCQPLQEGLEAWDYSQPLVLETELDWDIRRALEGCGICPEEITVGIDIICSTGTTAASGCRWVEQFHPESLPSPGYRLTLRPDSSFLSGRLLLTTQLTVRHSRNPQLRPGARLFEATTQIALEGIGGTFPMEIVPFSSIGLEGALWYLSWTPENAEDSLLGNVVLYINSEAGETARDLAAGRNPMLEQLMTADAVSTLIGGALRTDSFLENRSDYPDGSIGDVVIQWIGCLLQGYDLGQLRSMAQREPGRLTAMIQSGLTLTAGGQS